MAQQLNTNGEKKILWRGVEALLALLTIITTVTTTAATWAITDYLAFKHQHVMDQARQDERMRWEESTLMAIAKKLDIPIPPPPERN